MLNVFSFSFLFAYSVHLNGASDSVIKEFNKQSVFAQKTDKNHSVVHVDFNVQQDLLLLKNVLNAYGYLEHSVSYQINGKKIVFDVQAGKADTSDRV